MAPADEARVAVSVSKKVSKKAVTRNLIRRRTYAAVADFYHELKPGLYLFSARPGAQKAKGERLKSELRSLVVSRRL